MHSSKKSNRRRSDSLSLIKLLAKRQLTIKNMEMIFLLSEQLIAAIAAYGHQHNNDSDSLHLNRVMAISDTAREWFPNNRPLNEQRVTLFVQSYDTYDKESLMDQIRENMLSIRKRAVDCNLGTISDYLNTIISEETHSFIINPSHNVLFPPIDPQNEDIDVDIMGGQNPSPVSSTSESAESTSTLI